MLAEIDPDRMQVCLPALKQLAEHLLSGSGCYVDLELALLPLVLRCPAAAEFSLPLLLGFIQISLASCWVDLSVSLQTFEFFRCFLLCCSSLTCCALCPQG